MDEDFLAELKQCFFEDSLESFEKSESCFIEIEKEQNIDENLDEISRQFHNIKGGAKSIGFSSLGDFCHIAEDLIVAIKNKVQPLNSENIDCLLKCNDLLKESLGLLERSELPDNYFSSLKKEVLSILNDEVKNTETQNIKSEAKTEKVLVKNTPELEMNKEVVEGVGQAQSTIAQDVNSVNSVNQNKSKPKIDQSIKMPLNRIDNLINLFGEQSINLSRLNSFSRNINENSIKEIRDTLNTLNKLTHDLQQTILSLRMIKVDKLFSRLERVVRETAKQVGKQINFETVGKDSELDKTIVDSLLDPLMHMVRNAVDHGIEADPTTRIFAGKDEVGTVTLSAYRKGGNFIIELKDDGKGIDKNALLNKAIEKKIISNKNEIAESEIYSLIFRKGFSSAEKLTDVSGRGVGMDVVNQMINKLRGQCEITSEVGEGTTFTISLPLNLAMINGTLVEAREQKYIIPNSDFSQTIQVSGDKIKESNINNYCLEHYDYVYPVLSLHNIFNKERKENFKENNYVAALVEHKKKKFAILLDDLVSQEKIILKKLDEEIESVDGILGGAILGDGNVVLVLEVKEIIEKYLIAS